MAAQAFTTENLNIFKNEPLPTAIYIFHNGPKGVRHFGFVRKIPQGGRVAGPKGNIGAAGTDIKYHGKWTTIGGGAKGNMTNIERAINELNDETAVESRGIIKKFTTNDVDLRPSGFPNAPRNQSPPILCHLAQKYNRGADIAVFLFEIPDETLFFNIFPKAGYTGQDLATASLREIDAIQSYNMDEIVQFQGQEYANNQNYFTAYTIRTFQDIILPKMFELSPAFAQKWNATRILVHQDATPRTIAELNHDPYKKKYLKYKNKYLQLKKQEME